MQLIFAAVATLMIICYLLNSRLYILALAIQDLLWSVTFYLHWDFSFADVNTQVTSLAMFNWKTAVCLKHGSGDPFVSGVASFQQSKCSR